MKDLAVLINSRIPTEVEYGDVRVVSSINEHIIVKNGKIEAIEVAESLGFGVRILVGGYWGFAARSKLDTDTIDSAIKEAVDIAKTSGVVRKKKKIFLSPLEKIEGKYKTPYKKNPFDVSLEDKLALLLELDEILKKSSDIKVRESQLGCSMVKKVFASTEGSLIEQELISCGGEIRAIAVEGNEVQVRSYGNYGCAGYEFVKALDLLKNAPRVRDEACKLLRAKQCPGGEKDLIIDGGQLVLQIHESIGHAVELDRVFGTEASYAGRSFVTPDKLNKFRYGSEIINVTADATSPLGLGTFGWDDEGVPAQSTPIIRNGIFVGYLSSRETAPMIERRSSGTMRASSWNRIPLIRMTNINLEPGEWKLDELIGDTKDGLFLQTNKSWSIDDMRENFQFTVEFAREIKNGKLGEVVKDVTYTGYTPDFWRSCDGICNKDFWKMYGVMNCGKGEPGQIMQVGHGTSPARFRNIRLIGFKK